MIITEENITKILEECVYPDRSLNFKSFYQKIHKLFENIKTIKGKIDGFENLDFIELNREKWDKCKAVKIKLVIETDLDPEDLDNLLEKEVLLCIKET